MPEDQKREAILAAVDASAQRREYPKDFPILPEIPAGRYTDEEFQRLELEHVFRKSWLYAGHVSELPEPGSYKLFERIGVSIILLRDTNGGIRAFHNTCRHRGSALLTEPKGKVRRFVCPYHAWGFTLDGELVSVPEAHNFGCLNKDSYGLVPVRCDTWRGMIYINLDKESGPLLDFLGDLPRQLEGFPLEDLEVKTVQTIRVDCNWKALRDNFLEVYHVKAVHPQSVAPWIDTDSFTVWSYRRGHGKTVSRNPFHRVAGQEKPFPEGTDELFRNHIMAIFLFPNAHLTIDTGGFPILTFWPDGSPGKSLVEMPLMGWKDEAYPQEYWDNLMQSSLVIADEDVRLLDTIQKSLESGAIDNIVVSCVEQGIYWYHEEIERMIGPENVPEHLRVKQVMKPAPA